MYYHVLYHYIYIKELSGCSQSRFNLHVPYFEGKCSQIIAASFWYWAARLWCFKPDHQDYHYIFSRSSRIDLLGGGNTPNLLVPLKCPPQKNTFSQWCSRASPKRKTRTEMAGNGSPNLLRLTQGGAGNTWAISKIRIHCRMASLCCRVNKAI